MPEMSNAFVPRHKGDKEPREKILKLGQKITDRIGVKITTDDPEYWGLACIVTDEMADICLAMKVRHSYKIDELVKLTKRPKEELEPLLQKMGEIGIIEYHYGNNYDDNGPIKGTIHEKEYVLPIFVPGSAEFTNMVEKQMDEFPELAQFFERMTFLPLAGLTEMVPPGGAGVGMHVIPVEKAISMESKASNLEKISYWLKKYEGHIGVSTCSCRYGRAKLGEGCGDDPQNWCISLGDMADYCRETGKGHDITYDEAIEILKNAEANGFVHQITNIDGEDKIFAICNCNVNICNALRTSQLFNTPNLSRSAYTAEVETAKCVACGQCVEFCPAGAVKLGQKLCTKDGPIKYPKHVLPDRVPWGPDMWDEDYRDNNRINCYPTGTAPCKTACPAHIAVQGYIKMASQGRYKDALALIKKENPFPAICGRVCPHKCEDACTRNTIDKGVAIDAIKKFIAEQDLNAETRYIPEIVIPSNNGRFKQKIAIIGGGPAGLSCAYFLATKGYYPTVFEKNEKPGGMLTYGIPSYKLENKVIEAEIEILKEIGVEIKCGVEVGKDVTISELRNMGYQAFYLAVGCQGGKLPGILGQDAKGVETAIDFLHRATDNENQTIDGDVIVVGGGNVAIDAARTSTRFGATKVSLFSLEGRNEMPANNIEIKEALDENIEINNGWGPKEIITKNGKVTAVVFKKCLRVFNEDKRFSPIYDDNQLITVPCSKVIFAIGQDIKWGELLKGTNVTLNAKKSPVADPLTYQTTDPDIFVGGDVYTGPNFAIRAIAAGKEGAISLHRYVQKGTSLTIGRNCRDFIELNKQNLLIDNYDEAGRQEAGMDEKIEYKKSFRDAHLTLTEEQVKIETKRCLGCGASIVDENKCIGCGICTTKCEFDAIHLHRTLPEATRMYKSEDKLKAIAPYAIKRACKIAFAKKTEDEKAAIKAHKEYKKQQKENKK